MTQVISQPPPQPDDNYLIRVQVTGCRDVDPVNPASADLLPELVDSRDPNLYKSAHPYVDDKVICEILTAARPGWSLQEMAEELRPETYHANTKIRIGDLEKAAGKAGMISLEDAGIVKTHVYVSGELEVISRAVAEAKPRAELQEGEDEE